MDIDQYVETRLKPEIDWYDLRARQNKLCFRLLSGSAVGLSAAIPFAVAASATDWVVALLGALAAVAVGMLSLLKCQESWLHYRSIAETLKKERFHFETLTGPYGQAEPDELRELLVGRVEASISGEHQVWREKQEPGDAATA